MDSKEEMKVYEIDINKKYLLAFDNFIPDEAFDKIKEAIAKWLEDENRPILLLRGVEHGVHFVKIEQDGLEEK